VTYAEAVAYIDSLLDRPRSGGGPETAKILRTAELLRRLGDPHRGMPTVLVAGTKGKGSTAAMLAAVMRASGARVGLYTKPHLADYRERIQVDGEMISPDAVASLVSRLRPHVEAMASHALGVPTYFEVSVALAFAHFADAGVDLAVVEVGLGGRLDATNVADPVLAVLTPVSYDHMEVLGTTLDAIAREKAGIVRRNGVVVSAPQVPEPLAAIIDVCARHHARLRLVSEEMRWQVLGCTPYRQTVALAGPSIDYGVWDQPLVGAHQAANAATAVAAAEVLGERGFPFDPGAVGPALAALRWPGRIEVVAERPYVVVDVAHNPASLAALRQTVETVFPHRRVILVFGMVATHDHRMCTGLIAPLAAAAVVTTPRHVRPLPAAVLAEEVARYVSHVEVIPDRHRSVRRALELASPEDVVVVTGSFFLVGDVRAGLRRGAVSPTRTSGGP
jgi:dihydrofolate synthase/folylpolyglutamate synthase